jgi:hypothetical protein
MEVSGKLFCAWCHKEIGMGGSIKFIKFHTETKMYHKEPCYKKAVAAAENRPEELA